MKENEFRDSKECNVMVFQVTPMLPVCTMAGYQPLFTQRQVGLPVDCRCGCYRLPQIKMLSQTMDCDWSQAKPSSLRCTLYTVWPAGYRPAGRQDWYRLSLRAHTRRPTLVVYATSLPAIVTDYIMSFLLGKRSDNRHCQSNCYQHIIYDPEVILRT